MMVFILFWLLFDKTVENAFVNIGGNNPGVFIPERDKQFYFWIAVIRSMFFNPIGEEFLYREVIHGSFTPKFWETAASVFDSLAFAHSYRYFGLLIFQVAGILPSGVR
ncbi:MAG: type II CAAX prenyl endopeptidase Rce1 family protein [Odoribacter splanchnicus]